MKLIHISAKVNLFGIVIIFIAFLNDFFIGQGLYTSWNLMMPAVALYIIIHIVSMSKQFADSVSQTERQNVKLRELNASNEILAEKLQAEIKRKDQFLANTSHELRNPLQGIINIAHSILINKSNTLDEKMQDEINLQVMIGHHMARTLDDLLDVTRLKEQRITLKKSNFQLGSVVQAVIDMLEVLLEHRDIAIELDIDDQLPEVTADENRFIQILFNLLHNALKYTYEGTIVVRAYVEGEFINVEIEDTGIGMDEAILDKLFLPYEQGTSDLIPSSGGLGLGLSICKELVELHGGTISAKSTEGLGSTFTFTLPILAEAINEVTIAETEVAAHRKDELTHELLPNYHKMLDGFAEIRNKSRKSRILLVDDDHVNLKVINNVLSANNYDIKTANNGKHALEMLNENNFDLLISNVLMPKMSGYELTKKIRETYSISELPIILLTARDKSDDIYTSFFVGANDYLIKPIDAMELMIRVNALTDLQASINERLRMEAAWLHAQIRPHFLLNTLNSIISLSQIDTDRMLKLIEHFAYYLHSSFQFKNIDKLIFLEDELELLESYLYIQQERFGERLQVVWDLVAGLDVMVPPLSIQTLVENAIHHGILPKEDGGTVTIRTRHVLEGVAISILDDGIGMDAETMRNLLVPLPDHKRGIGLINTEQRLQRLFGSGLQIESKLNQGASFTFIVPQKSNPKLNE